MAIRTDSSGRRTFGRGDEIKRGRSRGVVTDIADLGLSGTDQVLNSTGLESLKLSTHAALEELRTRLSQALAKINNALSGKRVEPGQLGGEISKVSGVPKDNEVAVFLSANQTEGDPNFTWDKSISELSVTGNQDITGSAAEIQLHVHGYQTQGSVAIFEVEDWDANDVFVCATAGNTHGTTVTFDEGFTSGQLLTAGQVGVGDRVVKFTGANRTLTHSSLVSSEVVYDSTLVGDPTPNVLAKYVGSNTELAVGTKLESQVITSGAVLTSGQVVIGQGLSVAAATSAMTVSGSNAVFAGDVDLSAGQLTADQDTTFLADVTASGPVAITGSLSLGGILNVGDPVELTIASGAVTISATRHTIDTESDAATDDLDTINGGGGGDIIILGSAASARDTTLKDGVGNLRLAGDFTLSNRQDTIMLMYDTAFAKWFELSRSDNET
jgi:hypothetical protein